MKIQKVTILLAILLILAGGSAAAADYTLFSGGATSYSIVISPKATQTEKNAATQLQSYLKKIGKANFSITTNTKSQGKHIFVGIDASGKTYGSRTRSFGEKEKYTYLSKNGNIYIYGNDARSTMYGVFSFLEDIFGVRWFTPDVTKVPTMSKYTFSSLNKTSTAMVSMRNVGYKDANNSEFCAHNKLNANYVTDDLGGCDGFVGVHTSKKFITPAEYFDSHPEYFALYNGKRIKDGQLCLTNSNVIKILTEKLLKSIEENPNGKIYDLSQDDNANACQCSKCSALVEKYGAQSGVWIWLVNQVAREVKKKYPTKYVATFAYWYTRTPPKGIVPEDNVVIRLCSIECCFMHSLEGCSQEANKKFLDDIKTWSGIAKNLYIWDYVVSYSQYLAPFPNFNVLGPNIRTFANHNAIGIYEEAQYQTLYGEFSELRTYLLSKLLWDPSLDVNTMVNEFIDTFYGSASSSVRKYYTMMMNLVGGNTHTNIYPQADNALYNDAFVSSALTLLAKAKKQCKTEDELKRAEHIWLSPAYLHIKRNLSKAKADGIYDEFLRIVKRDDIRICETLDLNQFISSLK